MDKYKNILFLMTDQHRLDHVEFSGMSKIETPNIDRIADSVGFTCCQTVNPICTPARTALITGKYPHQIGTLDMSGDLSLQHPTYLHALQKAGYHTCGIGKFHFLQTWRWSTARGKGVNLLGIKDKMKEYGFDYVWETSGKQLAKQNYCDYCEHLNKKGLLEQYRDFIDEAGPNSDYANHKAEGDAKPWPFAEEDYVDILTADKIIERIENRPAGKPFFIFGSFCSPHKPFDPPQCYLDMVEYEELDDFIPGDCEIDEEDKKKLYKKRRAYKAMVLLLDDQIGRILDTLEKNKLLDDTVILFTSDHGEMLGDHARIQKSTYWRASVTVPAAIRHPDFLVKKINNSPVEIIDLTATILDIAGIDYEAALSKDWPRFNNIVPCRSLMPIVAGKQNIIRDFTFTECEGRWQMIQSEKYKYVRHLGYSDPDQADEEFYDLQIDPDETNNVIKDPNYTKYIDWCRKRRDFIMDNTPPAQTFWAPLGSDHTH